MTNNLPCENCICLAICKNQILHQTIKNNHLEDFIILYFAAKNALAPKCSLFTAYIFREYVKQEKNYAKTNLAHPNVFKVLEYMGLIE